MESLRTLGHIDPADHRPIIDVVDESWGGRHVVDMLARLFFTHFRSTSFVAELDVERVGFLIGFLSQTFANQAYVHFLGVDPACRGQGIAAALYEQYFVVVRAAGRDTVKLVTCPANATSIAFHLHTGSRRNRGMRRSTAPRIRATTTGPARIASCSSRGSERRLAVRLRIRRLRPVADVRGEDRGETLAQA